MPNPPFFFEPGVVFRIPIYIMIGICSEVLFTAVSDLLDPKFLKSWNVFGSSSEKEPPPWRQVRRDTRALGYTFLWMLPIYALLVFIEPASDLLKNIHPAFRGLIYVMALWTVEYITGFLIKKLSGRCPWDYSQSTFNFHGYIRWDFFPFWFGFVVFVEWMSTKLIELTPWLIKVFY